MSASVPPPFLSLDERIAYLEAKNYLFGSVPGSAALGRLRDINFHYFLGYARNFRLLGSAGRVPTDDALDRVLAIMDADLELSVAVFRSLRKLEWRLRAIFVEHHCEMFDPSGCYLDPAHYMVFNPDLPPIEMLLAKHIRRSREPYVVDHLATCGDPGALPVWAVVDTWSFSALSRALCEAAPVRDPDGSGDIRLWKKAALSLGISASVITTNLEALSVLRNLVAHHSRLWMRPSACTPKIPKVFPASVRNCIQTKSMYGVFLALAEMLGPERAGRDFLHEVDGLLERNPAFRHGIIHPIST